MLSCRLGILVSRKRRGVVENRSCLLDSNCGRLGAIQQTFKYWEALLPKFSWKTFTNNRTLEFFKS